MVQLIPIVLSGETEALILKYKEPRLMPMGCIYLGIYTLMVVQLK